MRRRGNPEQLLHIAVARFLAVALPEGSGVAWSAFPAGGGGRVRGAILKGLGLKPGWPDMIFLHAGRFFGVELKAKDGVLSVDQADRHAEIRAAGGEVAICRTLEAVELQLRRWELPLRASCGGFLLEEIARRNAA